MKKIFFFLIFLLFLVSCWENQEAIEKAKQEMLSWSSQTGEILDSYYEQTSPSIDVESSWSNDVIRIDPIDEKMIVRDDENKFIEVTINGQALDKNIQKIIVNFKNETSNFPSDQYELKTFKPWDTEFHYRASSLYRVLDYGVNQYTFVAYLSGSVFEKKVTVTVPKGDTLSWALTTASWASQSVTNSKDVFASLPHSVIYGDPVSLSSQSFSYSQLKWLEVRKEAVPSLSCSDSQALTDFLVKKYGYTYWNTCRDIAPGKWLRVNVVRSTWESTFVYETHIIDSYNQLYGTYLLTSWNGGKDALSAKNDEFKSQTFKGIDAVSELFKDLSK